MRARAAILLAFANDWVDDQRHLRSLLDESKAIDAALVPLVETGALVLPSPIQNATINDVIRAFQKPRYRDRIRIFHFGGHASGSTLLFENPAGEPSAAHAEGLAGYLGRQRGLILVFLNGCCTAPQVRRLREAGVKAVVATTSGIQDGAAAEFAAAFYAELATRSLREAFEIAVHAVRVRRGDDPRAVMRDVAPHDQTGAHEWPWVIDCDPGYESWTLGNEVALHARRIWRRWLLLATAATLLVWMTALAVSVDARRLSCRAPGIHSLCEVAGIGVPSPDEQTLWEAAQEQRSADALQAYLRRYPDGFYSEQAQSRLDGCRGKRIEKPGPEKDQRVPRWLVNRNPARAFATIDEARADALQRGKEDAATTCAALGMKDRLLSASIEPSEWSCTELDHGFTCGLTGELNCRVQTVVLTEHVVCSDDPE